MRVDLAGNRTQIYQSPRVATFSDLATVLGRGTTIIVTDTSGRKVQGELTALSSEALSV